MRYRYLLGVCKNITSRVGVTSLPKTYGASVAHKSGPSSIRTRTELLWEPVLLWALVLLLFFLTTFPVSAQSTPPEMDMDLAWENYVTRPGWIESQITLTNENSQWEGELLIRHETDQIVYRIPLVLPAHSHKYYRVPTFVRNVSLIRVELRDNKGNLAVNKSFSLVDTARNRICVVADTTGLFPAQELDNCVPLLIQDLTRLPETAMAWDAISVLLINGMVTSDLTPAQQEAMLAWVAAGGHLVLSGGAALPQTLAGMPPALQVVSLEGVQTVNVLHLANQPFHDISTGVLIPHVSYDALVTREDLNLAIRSKLGTGQVDVVGWDLVQTPSLVWLEDLWSNDPVPAIRAPIAVDADTGPSANVPSTYSLFEIPQRAAPGFQAWLLLFPVYILLMGPGTWFLVRRLRRPSLAWIILPIWIVLSIVILAFGLSGQFSLFFPLSHQIAHIYVPGENLPARVVQGTAMYAPRVRKVAWETEGLPRWLHGSYAFDDSYSEGSPYPLDIRYLENSAHLNASQTLGVITWGTEGVTSFPTLTSDLHIDTRGSVPELVGTLYSKVSLTEVSLIVGNERFAIELAEELGEGEMLDIKQPIEQSSSSTFTNYNTICWGSYYHIPSVSAPIFIGQPDGYTTSKEPDMACYIGGLLDGVPFPVRNLGGTEVAESCVLYAIPCPIQSKGIIKVPLVVVSSAVEKGWIDTADNCLYISGAGVTIPYLLPSYLQIQDVQSIEITVGPSSWQDATSFDPTLEIEKIELWNWQTEDWEEVAWQDDPTTFKVTGTQAQSYFDPRAGVKVEVTPRDMSSGTNVTLDVEIEGSW